jgi:hypothetical protein
MDDGALIEAMLGPYRDVYTSWQPPEPGALTGPAGGFSGGPYGLAVRYVLRGEGAGRECVWLETSRMGGTLLWRLDAASGDAVKVDEMWTGYMHGDTEAETALAVDRMHQHNAAFWERAAELGLDEDLPAHTVVNAYLTSAAAGEPDPPGPAAA